MEKKGLFSRLKILSKPTGKPLWIQAVKSIFLMILAALIAQFLGFGTGLKAIIFTTLLATIIIDITYPLRKIAIMTLIGFIMATLAFICSSLALYSLPLFLFFTVIWAFFTLSLYIFSETVGTFGFILFAFYFISVIVVNRDASTFDWAIYIILSFAVASLLFIPKILGRKKDISKMVASPFIPGTSLQRVLSVRQALSGINLDKRDYDLFRIGNYFAGYRGYSKVILSRLSDESRELFQNFLDNVYKSSKEIAENIINNPTPVNLHGVEAEMEQLEKNLMDPSRDIALDVARDMSSILKMANDKIVINSSQKKIKISSPHTSFKDVIRANFNFNNIYIRHAVRFTLAMTIGLLAVYLSHERDAIWITMGILIVIKPDVTSTINNMIVRVSFNFLAIILAIILAFFFPHQVLIWIALLMLFLFRAFYPTYMALSVMVLSVFVVLIWPTGTVFENGTARLLDVCIGAIIAFICSYIILPTRMTVNLPEKVSEAVRANLDYAQKIFVTSAKDYSHEGAVLKFRNYMLAENNLGAAIKKMEDTFNDIEEDILYYQEIAAANNKIAGDLSALATSLESKGFSVGDLSPLYASINHILSELIETVGNGEITSSAKPFISVFEKKTKSFDNEPYIKWIASDLNFLVEQIERGAELGIFTRYNEL